MRLSLFVIGIVGLNVTSSIVLNMLASSSDPNPFVLSMGFAVVFLLNGWRLVIWMFANRRFPLSTIYPFTSLFFPVMLVVSFAYHEPITLGRIAGTLLITAGVFWLGWRVSRSVSTPL